MLIKHAYYTDSKRKICGVIDFEDDHMMHIVSEDTGLYIFNRDECFYELEVIEC